MPMPKPPNPLTVSDLARLGGQARAAALSPARRREIATKASRAAKRARNKRLKKVLASKD